MAELEQYKGREQSFIKHEFLTQYLQAAAYKTLQGRSSIFNFVDAFAGPWRVTNDDLSDASFDQALRTLEAVRADLGKRGGTGLKIRFCLCERRREAVAKLVAYAKAKSNFEIHIFPGLFEDNLDKITAVCRDGFTFTFIDPTGWNVRSEPIFEFLKAMNGEFIINFMADPVNRHATYDQVSASFGRFLADPLWRNEFTSLPTQLTNEERILLLFKRKIKAIGAAAYLPEIPISKPRENRIYMRLILGTHSRKGLEVFRDVHSKVELSEITTRGIVAENKTAQLGLWSKSEDSEGHQRAIGVGSQTWKAASSETVLNAVRDKSVRFNVLAAEIMERWPMRLTHVKDLLMTMRQEGLVAFELPPRQKPQPDTLIKRVTASA